MESREYKATVAACALMVLKDFESGRDDIWLGSYNTFAVRDYLQAVIDKGLTHDH